MPQRHEGDAPAPGRLDERGEQVGTPDTLHFGVHREHVETSRLDPAEEALVVVPHADPVTPDQLVVGRQSGRNLGGLWYAMEQGRKMLWPRQSLW